jgi:hypothetical protein
VLTRPRPGLHPHCPRQGPHRVCRRLPPRPAQRPGPHRHHRRPPVRRAPRRGHRHGNHLQLARPRPPNRQRHLQPRLRPGPGLSPVHRPYVCPRQFPHRRCLPLGQPPHAQLGAALSGVRRVMFCVRRIGIRSIVLPISPLIFAGLRFPFLLLESIPESSDIRHLIRCRASVGRRYAWPYSRPHCRHCLSAGLA